MPQASKRKRGGGKTAPKSKRGKKMVSKEVITSDSDNDDNDNDEGGDSEWVVEEVVGKRIIKGKVEYFLKWKNWPPSTNTWEPEEHLNCRELVEAYEAKLTQKEETEDEDDRTTGFDAGLTTRGVRGIVELEKNGRKQLHYLIEWEDTDTIEPVLASIVREKIPQEVIRFLSAKIKWVIRGSRPKKIVENGKPSTKATSDDEKADDSRAKKETVKLASSDDDDD